MNARTQPNILLIMSDQHSRHVAGCYGDPVVRTPSLDSIASAGVTFAAAYCPCPLCAPSRMSFMTGRRPYELGIWDNGAALSSDTPTFAHALGAAGYETVLCGRMHFCGPDQRHGFDRRVFPEVTGHAAGDLVGTNGFERTSFEKSGPGRNHYLLYDEQCTSKAVRWLAERAGDGQRTNPFCLVVGLVGPHCPFVCPRELFDRYYEAIRLPCYPPEHLDGLHPYVRRFRRRSKLATLTEHEIRRTRAAYYGMIEFDDRQVGLILNALGEAGLADDTVVIYTSDHGDMAGEHGLWWKMSFYEGSAGVPLIVSWPGHFRQGHVEPSPVSLVDLAPTLADVAGAPAMPGASGETLTGLLRGTGPAPCRTVFSEMHTGAVRRTQGSTEAAARMMRRAEWKCNYYHHEPPELFNLSEDPDEMTDRAGDPACRDVLADMLAEIHRGWDPDAVDASLRRQIAERQYVRSAPAARQVVRSEYWFGPEGYGCVEPV